jgi:hypothetical protein
MRLTSKYLGMIVVGFIFGGIAFSSWMGWWQTESSKEPVRFESGDAAGAYNPADIRGSYSFGDVSALFNIPLEDLGTAFMLADENVADVDLKELEERYADLAAAGMEIGTGSVRLFVAFYTGLPFETSEEYLLAPAMEVLKEQGNLSEERLAYLQNHVVRMNQVVEPLDSTNTLDSEGEPSSTTEGGEAAATEHIPQPQNPANSEEEHDPDEVLIKGKTTFREVLDWGLTQEEIETVLGQAMPNPLVTVKDFCFEQGLEFGTIKTELQTMLDEIN